MRSTAAVILQLNAFHICELRTKRARVLTYFFYISSGAKNEQRQQQTAKQMREKTNFWFNSNVCHSLAICVDRRRFHVCARACSISDSQTNWSREQVENKMWNFGSVFFTSLNRRTPHDKTFLNRIKLISASTTTKKKKKTKNETLVSITTLFIVASPVDFGR